MRINGSPENRISRAHRRSRIAACLLAPLIVAAADRSTANPKGGVVVAGEASIIESGSRLDITQTSDRAIVDWRSFGIDPGEHTNFDLPTSASVILNRVGGTGLSRIDGLLTGNGNVFLINPNGVIFGRNAQVAVGGLVASTADVANEDFMAGHYLFGKASDDPDAAVVNLGRIEITDGGAAVLAAPTVRNDGGILARFGTVELAGANTFTLDFHGDGLLSFGVGADVTPTAGAAAVANSGTISADGGVVALTAASADAVVDRVINMDGIIEARTVDRQGGTIILSGGSSGIVDVSGTLDVTGTDAGESAGAVQVLGDRIGLFDGTRILADGDAGGGEVLVGGNIQGNGPEPNATQTYVDDNAEIHADALTDGDGGRVIVWADGTTRFNGDISARGGAEGGDGGFVEVSGKSDLGFVGSVALDARHGAVGTLLLDPENITIDAVMNTDDAEVADGEVLFADRMGEDLTISEAALEAVTGGLVLQANQDITVNAGLAGGGLALQADSVTLQAGGAIASISPISSVSAGTVVMQAGQNIATRSISTAGGDLVMQAGSFVSFINAIISTSGGNIVLESDSSHTGIPDGDGGIIFQGSIAASEGGNVTLIAPSLSFDVGGVIAGAGNINAATGPVGPTLDPSDFDVDGIFDNLSTESTLVLGRATTAGSDGLGTGARLVTVNNITADALIQSTAPETLMVSANDIIVNGGIDTTFDGVEDRDMILRGGNNVDFLGGVPPGTVTTGSGRFEITAGGTLLLPPLVTNGGSVILTSGGTLNAPAITTSGGDIVLTVLGAAPAELNLSTSLDAGTGNIVITADNIVNDDPFFTGASLLVQPNTPDRGLFIGEGGTFGTRLLLDQNLLDGIQPGFAAVTVGRDDGVHAISLQDVLLVNNSPLIVRSPLGGEITIEPAAGTNPFSLLAGGSVELVAAGGITGNGQVVILGDTSLVSDGPITLADPGNVLGGNLNLASGGANAIRIVDSTLLSLGNIDVGTGPLALAGDGVSQTVPIIRAAGAMALSIDAGAGPILLNDMANALTGVINLSNNGSNDVTLANSGQLLLGTVSVGSGALNLSGTGISQSGSIVQEAGAAGALLDGRTGGIALTSLANDFTGSVSLATTGNSNVEIFDVNTLTLGLSALGSGQATVTAADLDIADLVSGTGALLLQPSTPGQSIGIGDAAGAFGLSNPDIANLAAGFSSITIGRPGMTGQVGVQDAFFVDPLTIQADGAGAGITVTNALNAQGGLIVNGSGASTILSGNIITNGNAIVINDAMQLATDVLLDTTNDGATAGSDIQLNGVLDGRGNTLTLRGGFVSNRSSAPLDVGGLVVIPTGQAGNGARLFGAVGGQGDRRAAPLVEGVREDPNFTLNGCVMGIACEGYEPLTRIHIPAPEEPPRLPEMEIPTVWDRQGVLADPRDARYSNFGNEELWWQ